MMRVLIAVTGSNIAVLNVACERHGDEVLERGGLLVRVSPIDETDAPCAYCEDAHARDAVADWPLDVEVVSTRRNGQWRRPARTVDELVPEHPFDVVP